MHMASIEVDYENGVFRPLEPEDLPEGVTGEVVIDPSQAPPVRPISEGESEPGGTQNGHESPGQRAYRLLLEIAALTQNTPDTPINVSEHHEDVLYPKEGRMP